MRFVSDQATPTVPGWIKSSKSGPNCDNCVETSTEAAPGAVAIRDTEFRDKGTLVVSRAAFVSFTRAAATGAFAPAA